MRLRFFRSSKYIGFAWIFATTGSAMLFSSIAPGRQPEYSSSREPDRLRRTMADEFDTTALEPLEVLSLLSEQARTLRQQIAWAPDVASLQLAALQIPVLVARLHRAGCTAAPIAALVQALSRPLFERAW